MNLKLIQINEDGTFDSDQFNTAEETADTCKSTSDFYKIIGFQKPWICYLAADDKQIIGTCGFKGKPLNNKVELAYFTFPKYEGKGYATAMCGELIKIKQAADPNNEYLLIAQTLNEKNASNHILQKHQFIYAGEATDEDAGIVWEWHLKQIY